MHRPILSVEEFENPKPPFFTNGRLFRWALLVVACWLLTIEFIPTWQDGITVLITWLWLLAVLWEIVVFVKSLGIASLSNNRVWGVVSMVLWSLLFGFCNLFFARPFAPKYLYTISTFSADIYVCEDGGFIDDSTSFVLKRQNYPYPTMRTIVSFLRPKPEVQDSVITVNNVPIYDLRTHQILVNQ